MKKHIAPFGLSSILGLVAGAVIAVVLLKGQLETAMAGQKEIERQLDELRSAMETANNELLILRAELDLRQEQLRRLLEDEGESQWRSLN